MKRFAIGYGLVLVLMLAFDFVWLSATAETLYRPAMHGLMRDGFVLAPAVAFYVLYAFAMTWVVVKPVLFDGGGWPRSAGALSLRAGLFALAAFGTYDLTAMAVIRDWPVTLSFIDMGWGTLNALLTVNLAAFLLRALGQIN